MWTAGGSRKSNMKKFSCILLLLTVMTSGCKDEFTPKPYGYFRIDFPEKNYKPLESSLPYRFDMAGNATVETDNAPDAEPYWINLAYPAYNAKIHLSYKKITSGESLLNFQQDCHRMAYTHTIKAESINESYFRQDNGTFGLVYFIEGNTASSTQFFITDSTRHFLRGALYFNQQPAKDSLAPVIDYLRKDIVHLMETLQFENDKKNSSPK